MTYRALTPTILLTHALLVAALPGGCDGPYGDLGEFADDTGGDETSSGDDTGDDTDPTEEAGACEPRDPDVAMTWILRHPGDTEPALFGIDAPCTVVAATPADGAWRIDLDCLVDGASTPLEFEYARAPLPDIALFAPGASLRLDYRNHAEEVIDGGGDDRWIAFRTGAATDPPALSAMKAFKPAPGQLASEAFHGLPVAFVGGACPHTEPCAVERLAVEVTAASGPVTAFDGGFVDAGDARLWVGHAHTEHDTTNCFDSPGTIVVAMIERPAG